MNATTEKLAEIANRAEIEILKIIPADILEFYLSLPREARVEIACAAFGETAAMLNVRNRA